METSLKYTLSLYKIIINVYKANLFTIEIEDGRKAPKSFITFDFHFLHNLNYYLDSKLR